MKADLEYYYVTDLTPEVKVIGNIESVELKFREGDSRPGAERKWDTLLLTPADAREVAELLLRAADHVDDLNKGPKR